MPPPTTMPPRGGIKLLPLVTEMGLESCSFCKYWVSQPQGPDLRQPQLGLCRRYPPQMVLFLQPDMAGKGVNQIPQPLKPVTAAEDYCGEFTATNAG
jgi:hypothetical protein